MNSSVKTALIVMFVSLSMKAGTLSADDDRKPISPLEIDTVPKTRASDFLLNDLSGRAVSLSSLKGKVVLLNFWATWCPSCVAEMPSLSRLHHDMKSRAFQIIAIATDRSVHEVRGYLNKKPLDFPVLIDGDRFVTRQYKVFSLPTTFLIDKKGIIIDTFFGEYDWSEREMREKIERLF